MATIAFGFAGTGRLVDVLGSGVSPLSVTAAVMLKLFLVVGAAAAGLGAISQAVLAYVEQGERSAVLLLPVATGVIVTGAMLVQMLFPR